VFAAVALAVTGCGPESTSPSSSPAPPSRSSDSARTGGGQTPPAENKSTTPEKTTPDFKLTAEELYQESRKDRNFLINKHAGNLVELTGVVDKAILDLDGNPTLLLNGSKDMDRVNCPVGDRNHWSKAFPGQTVTLWGTVPLSSHDPKPLVWNIKAVTGPEPPKVTIEELVKAFAADPEAAEKKFKGKHLIVTGAVAAPQKQNGVLVGFRLKSMEKKPSLVCYVVSDGRGEKEQAFVKSVAKPGQKVTVLVEFTAYYSDEISMTGHVIDPPY
jgi:hypothetical protein